MVSLHVGSPPQKHFNGLLTVPFRLAFQLICHCNFTYNCILMESFLDKHVNCFAIFISSDNSFVI